MRPIVLPFALIAMSAQASTIVEYFDRASFMAAAGIVTVESFTSSSHLPIPSGVLNVATNFPAIGLFAGDILPGVTYSTNIDLNSSSTNEFNIDGGGSQFDGGFLDSLNFATDRPLTVVFDFPTTAFGFDTNGVVGGTSQVVRIGAQTWTLNLPSSPDPRFFGFVSSAADIGGLTLTSNGSSPGDVYGFALDNFTFATIDAPTVPEPATRVLLPAGLLGLIFLRVRFAAGGA